MIPTKTVHTTASTTTTTITTNHNHTNPFDEVGIINDSVFALREFSDIWDRLTMTPTPTTTTTTTTNTTTTTTNTVPSSSSSSSSSSSKKLHMTSLSYSYSAPYFTEYGPQHYWVESVFRGLDMEGLQRFRSYSCVPSTHPRFCRGKGKKRRKACIVTKNQIKT